MPQRTRRPFWPGLLAVGALGAVWLFGVLSAAQVVSQFAVIGLISAVVLTVFGTAWAKQLWFPLAFLFFAVPFGEAIVPRLMDWTADFTVAGVRLSGVPVYREGVHFVIPTGQWSVIEACSGIKFLIASIMAGSLYAWLMYRSPARRAAFLLASILVPLAANWLRAYSIVMIGHLSHNRLMTNEDHIVFGWVLFGAIMMLLYWLGARWREDRPEDTGSSMAAASRWQPARLAPAATVVALSLLAWPALAHQFMRPVGEPGRVAILAPDPLQGWERQEGPHSSWSPDLEGANATQLVFYRKGSHVVALVVAAYRHQTQMAQVGSTANQFARTTNADWKQTARGREDTTDLRLESVAQATNTAELRGLNAPEPLLVWQWYWAGDAATDSPARTKLELARSRLLRQPDTALWVAVYTPINERDRSEESPAGIPARDGPVVEARLLGHGGPMSGQDDRLLIAHVVYRFDIGGLENGVVNLLNRLPAERFRHAVVAMTEVTDFRSRVQRDDVQYVSLRKPPGQGFRIWPALYRLFRSMRPHIVHTRNLAPLEACLPAWAAGVPVRVHGEHGWDVGDLDGSNRGHRLARRLYRPFVSHYVALSSHIEQYLREAVGVPAERGDADL